MGEAVHDFIEVYLVLHLEMDYAVDLHNREAVLRFRDLRVLLNGVADLALEVGLYVKVEHAAGLGVGLVHVVELVVGEVDVDEVTVPFPEQGPVL